MSSDIFCLKDFYDDRILLTGHLTYNQSYFIFQGNIMPVLPYVVIPY